MDIEVDKESLSDWLYTWMDLEEKRKYYIKHEKLLRNAIIAHLDPGTREGTHRFPQEAAILKVGIKYSYGFDIESLEASKDDLNPEELEAIKWKPTLSLTAYRKIGIENRELLDSLLVVKLAQPSLALEIRGPEDDE